MSDAARDLRSARPNLSAWYLQGVCQVILSKLAVGYLTDTPDGWLRTTVENIQAHCAEEASPRNPFERCGLRMWQEWEDAHREPEGETDELRRVRAERDIFEVGYEKAQGELDRLRRAERKASDR